MTSVNHITPSQLTGVLATILSAGLTPMIWSAPGVGKSYIVNNDLVNVYPKIATAIADGRGIKLDYAGRQIRGGGKASVWERRAGDYDLLDYAGLPYVEDGIQRRASPDIWPGVGVSGKVWGILFLDEFTQAGREKQTVMQRSSPQIGRAHV